MLSKSVAQLGPLIWFKASVLTCSVLMLQTIGASSVVADPVNVRAWPHDGYGRLVFDWTQQVNFDIAQSESAVTINFTRPIEPELDSRSIDFAPILRGRFSQEYVLTL